MTQKITFLYGSFSEETAQEPLAFRMSPQTLDEYAGQGHILGEGKLLRRAIEADRITSLYSTARPGPERPLSQGHCRRTNAHFEWLNAATAGLDD